MSDSQPNTSDQIEPALSPNEEQPLTIKEAKEKAAGIPGVVAGLKDVVHYMKPLEGLRTSLKLNQKGGIDCPGCAWPDPDGDRSNFFEYCENGLKAIAEEAQKNTIDRSFFARHSIEELTGWTDFQLGKAGRIAEPLVLRQGATHYEPISWEDAFQLIATELNAQDSPDEAVFYTSGRASNEAAYLFQLFAREFGTNNLPDCSNMCHESTGFALSQTLGIGKGSVTLQDLHEAEVIMIIGQNPGTNHPRMMSALEKCKENSGKIIAVNPLPETGLLNFVNPQRPGKVLSGGTALSDLFLPVQINGDIALLKAIMLQLWHKEKNNPGSVFDWDFIQEYTVGYEEMIRELSKYDFNSLVEACGVPRADILKAADMLARAEKIVICWAMGITQQENGSENVREIVNLLLLKGAIGKPGAGTCPVRGHSNVQGDRTVGVWDKAKPELMDRLEAHFGFKPPREDGYASIDAMQAMADGKVRVFFSLGGNFLKATPDTELCAEGMRNCRLTAIVSTKLNRNHLISGKTGLILPCLGRTELDMQRDGEQFVSTENSTGVVQMSKGILTPCSEHLLSEPAIVTYLAEATLGESSKVSWGSMRDNYDNIRFAIQETIPGFENYNEKVREPGGFYLPNGARIREFKTDVGKAKFSVNPLPKNELTEGYFALTSLRSHDQFNTTLYGLNDRYRGVKGSRHVVFMNREDVAELGLQAGQKVSLVNDHGGKIRRLNDLAVIPYDIPKRAMAAYFPEMNVLVPVGSHDQFSKTPASKRVLVRVEIN
ncbi:MAG: FdhF/YdeP family oxidoreductase [Saprospiraceae bacterium]|nr:FdhF/YdeP family oxidoreductase [Lewinella sp.]